MRTRMRHVHAVGGKAPCVGRSRVGGWCMHAHVARLPHGRQPLPWAAGQTERGHGKAGAQEARADTVELSKQANIAGEGTKA